MQKELLKKRFSKSLKTYDDNAVIQKLMAKNLVNLIDGNCFEKVVELGCGTGLLTKEFTGNKNFSDYKAVDIVSGCEKYIKKIGNNISFKCCDLECFDNNIYSPKPNLIISNAAIQWIGDLDIFFKNIYNNLAEGGTFAFTLFGEENYRELKTIIKKPMQYVTTNYLKAVLSDFDIVNISEETKILEFNSPKDVLYHIKNTGVNAVEETRWTKSDLVHFEDEYQKICGKNITLTYHPIYVVVKKK